MEKFIDKIKDGIIHIKLSEYGEYRDTLISKYKILFEDEIRQTSKDKITAEINDNCIFVKGGKKDVVCRVFGTDGTKYCDEGYTIEFDAGEKERFFGLGDDTREVTMKRGRKTTLWVRNVFSYSPCPFLLSDEGWGLLVNTTFAHDYDLDSEGDGKIRITVPEGTVDLYFFSGESMKEILCLYTELSGRPMILPKAAYGLVFVNNEEEGARDLLYNCLNFRRSDIPCDIMGLEPGWMEKHYDCSTNKKWDSKRFYIPYWKPENYSGTWSFFYNLRQMGFGLTLWLCNDYDLLWEEEKDTLKIQTELLENTPIQDEHLSHCIIMDKYTKQGEPWFEHLKKFVDQGATGFKLDGAWQTDEHPDRLWAGRYKDSEVHNVYPVIHVRQLQNGYRDHTGRRAMIYTPNLFVGTQHYAATWAGDTGGLDDVLPYIFNMSFCGHSNTSCDIDITVPESLHFGFLLPWTQILAWRNWHHPWLLGDELQNMVREYSKLRSSLFPYIYSMSHKASKTGLSIARPLSLMYEDTNKYDNLSHVYMLGDSLLVGTFDMSLPLPEGRWYDYFTGDIYEGGKTIEYTKPEGRGGALFVKENSVFVTQKPKNYITEDVADEYQIKIFGTNKASSFDLIDDDGVSFDYTKGKINHTRFSVSPNKDGFSLCIDKINESYQRPHPASFEIVVFDATKPSQVKCNNENVDFEYDEKTSTLCIKSEKRLDETGKSMCYEFVF